jgi:hypothetical protein
MTSHAHLCAPLALVLLLAACDDDSRPPGIAEEKVEPNEDAITRELIALTKKGSQEASTKKAQERGSSEGDTLRFNQATHVGCLKADFSVEPDLPADLRVGLFAAPQTYTTWIRFANATDQSDTEEDFRGMSLKLTQVKGSKLLGSDDTHDFILNSHPVLFVANPEEFRDFIDYKLNSSHLLFFLNPFDMHIKSLRIALAGRQNHSSHLAIPYWSTTPYLFGEGRAVKYAAKPCKQDLDIDLPEQLRHGYLRDAMRQQLAAGGACFDFMVQFQTDAELMPIEDATVEWDETVSPFRRVARVHIPPQEFESPEQMEFCENLAYNPWRVLPEHRPLGGLNRVRKDLYQESARFRHKENDVNYTEPNGKENFWTRSTKGE